MLDAVRSYLQLASGLTEVTMRKAREVAASMLSGDVEGVAAGKDAAAGAARAVGSQVQELADDIVAQASANRELLVGLIRTEIDRAAGRMGLVREDELAAVRRHLQRVEDQVRALREDLGAAPAGHGAAKKAPAKKAAKKTAAKKTPVKKAVAPAPRAEAAPHAPTPPAAPAADASS